MAAQGTDILYSERMGIGGTISVEDIRKYIDTLKDTTIFSATATAGQNINGAKGTQVDIGWDSIVNNATEVSTFTDADASISIAKSGNVKVHTSVGIIDNGGNNRITYLLKLLHKDSTGATIYEYMLDDTYIRDDNNLYDSGVMAGFIELGVDAGDTLNIQVFMLDTQTPAAVVNASTTFSKIIIQRRL